MPTTNARYSDHMVVCSVSKGEMALQVAQIESQWSGEQSMGLEFGKDVRLSEHMFNE